MHYNIALFATAFTVLVTVSLAEEPDKFTLCKEMEGDVCNCQLSDDRKSLFVNCTNEELKTTHLSLPDGYDKKLIHIDLSKNKLTVLQSNLLSEFSENIVILNLGDNQITKIEKNAFDGFKNLEFLFLYGNFLTTLTGVFSADLAKLTELRVEKNKITVIEKKTFMRLTSLKQLKLSLNKLVNISNNAFDGLHELQILNMDSCKLEDVPWLKFDALTTLTLRDNDFSRVPNLDNVPTLKELDLSNNHGITEIAGDDFRKLSMLGSLEMIEMPGLWGIEQNAFRGLNNLRNLRIVSCPELYYISDEAFGKKPMFRNKDVVIDLQSNALTSWSGSNLPFVNISTLRLNHNKWVCDCNLRWMDNDLVRTAIGNDWPICAAPKEHEGKPATTIDAQQMTCPKANGSRLIDSIKLIMFIMFTMILFTVVIGAYHIYHGTKPCCYKSSRSIPNPFKRIVFSNTDPSFDYRSLIMKAEDPDDVLTDQSNLPTKDRPYRDEPVLDEQRKNKQRRYDDIDSDVEPSFV